MQVRFTFEPGDLSRYQRFGSQYLPWKQRVHLPKYQFRFVALLFWIIAAVFCLFILPHSGVPIQLGLVSFVLASILSGFFLLMGRGIMGLVLSSGVYPWLRGEQLLTISPSGVSYRNRRGEQSLTWQEVEGIRQDQYNLYLLLTRKGLLAQAMPGELTWLLYRSRNYLALNQVYIIPKRAFAQPLEAGTFFDLASSFWGNAHPTTPESEAT